MRAFVKESPHVGSRARAHDRQGAVLSKLKAARTRMKLSQAQLAQKLEITLPEYRRLENDEEPISVLYAMRLLALAGIHGWPDARPEDLCDPATAELVNQELDELEAGDFDESGRFVERLTDLCEAIDVLAVMCEVHGWDEAPHAHLDPDAFLATLENEADMVTTVFIDVEAIDLDSPVAEILGTIGLPWPDLDEVPERHQEAFRRIEGNLRAAFLKESAVPDWVRTEAVYDTGGGLLRATSVMSPRYEELRDTVLSWLEANRDEFLALEIDLDPDPDEPITRH